MISLLYVDDEPDLLELGKEFLERAGEYSVTPVTSAEDALALMASRHFDLVLSDYQMQGMNGIAFLKEVRSRYHDLPYILFTGRGREEVVIDAINNGADFYLQKGGEPLAQFTELSHKIMIATGRRRALDKLRVAYEQIMAQEEELRGQYDEMVTLHTRTDESQRMLQQVLNTVPVRVFWKDTSLRFLGCNEPFARDAGFSSPPDLIGKTDFEMGWREQAELYQAGDRNVIDNGISRIGYEEPQTSPGGRQIWLRTSKVPLRDAAGTITGVLGTYEDITSNKQDEEKLRLLRISVERAYDEVFWLDFEGNILYVNDSACRITGYSREELIAMKIFELDPDFPPEVWNRSVADLRVKGSHLFTTRHRCKNGVIIDVEIMTTYAMEGSKEFSFAFVRDITARKQEQEKMQAAYELLVAGQQLLQESEVRFRKLLEQSFDAAIIHRDGQVVFANDPAARLLKAPGPESLTGTAVMDLVDPVSDTVVRQRIRTMAESPENVVPAIEERFRCLDGTPVNVEVIASASVYRQKPAVLVRFRDISERKAAETTLRESEKRYRLILQHASDAIIIHEVTDEHPGRFIEVNDKACRMLGYTRKELLGMSIPDIDVPEQAAHSPAIQQQLFSEGTALFQTEHVTKDGTRIPVEVSDSLVTLDDRHAVLSIIRDLRTQKRTEQVLREANRKLGLLSSITRHDLRNKVHALLGYLALAKHKSADPVMTGFIEKLESVTGAISVHIEFTKIYEDLGSMEPLWLEIMAVIPRRQVPPELALEEELPQLMIFADPLISRVFSNLLDNTARHGETCNNDPDICKGISGRACHRMGG